MRFHRFLEIVRDRGGVPVRFDVLRDIVKLHHFGINDVVLWAIDFGDLKATAHFVLKDGPEDDRREGAREDPCFDAEIRFCRTLKQDQHEFNFVMTKELMHVFDGEHERVDTRAKFEQLMVDAESRPAPGGATPEWLAEQMAYWRALVTLCPKVRRDELVAEFQAGRATAYDIAEEFLIPERYARTVMGDNFEKAYGFLAIDPTAVARAAQ